MHRCNSSPRCKSEVCVHAKDHVSLFDCDKQAPCGCWPNNRHFQPMVKCIESDLVQSLRDCPDCGKSEAEGHHYADCIRTLKRELLHEKERADILALDLKHSIIEISNLRGTK